ncbi:hypothetical protein [Rhodopila sp.]|uniref:hypothetical protein n=1 Tax=Rhodopila sp. TaxID=2480087 RepID=UPI003D0E6234
MTWHYRVLRHPGGLLALHEVYCDEAGRPNGYTGQPMSFCADADDGPDGIITYLERALSDAKNRPILATSDFQERRDAR